jgi:hypothetical protein
MDVRIHSVKYNHSLVTKNLATQLAFFNNNPSNRKVICHGPIHHYFNSQKVILTWYVFIEKLRTSTHINILVIIITPPSSSYYYHCWKKKTIRGGPCTPLFLLLWKVLQKKQRKNEMMFRKIYNLKWTPNSKIKFVLNFPKKYEWAHHFLFSGRKSVLFMKIRREGNNPKSGEK